MFVDYSQTNNYNLENSQNHHNPLPYTFNGFINLSVDHQKAGISCIRQHIPIIIGLHSSPDRKQATNSTHSRTRLIESYNSLRHTLSASPQLLETIVIFMD